MLPVNSSRTFFWLYIQFIMVDIYFRNVHFKEVGLQFDCSPRSTKIWSRRRFKGISLYWWWQWGRRCEHCKREKTQLSHQLSQTDISANCQAIGPVKPSTFKPSLSLNNLKNEKKAQTLFSGDHEFCFLFLSHAGSQFVVFHSPSYWKKS